MTDSQTAQAIRGRRQWPLPKQADPSAPLLEVENLAVDFDLGGAKLHAVRGVSFRLDDGEALGIAGESGCGKTTTALSLIRLLPGNGRISRGQIRLFGYSPVIPSVHGNDFAYGHVTLGGRHMIVSGGFGVSRVPVRLGVPPEIVLLDLGTAPAVAGRQPGSA